MSSETVLQNESTATKTTQVHFIMFWFGQLFSLFGSSVVGFSIFIYLTEITEGIAYQGTLFTTVSAVVALPFVIMLFFTGPIVDRYDRKKIILIADSVQAFVTMVLAFLFISGVLTDDTVQLTIWVSAGIFLIRNVAQGLHGPAIQAIVPIMIKKENISRFNSISMFVTSAVQIAAPIFAGFLIGLGMNFKTLLWIDVGTFVIALVPTLFIKIPPPKPKTEAIPEKKASYREEFKDGFRTIWAIRGMPALFIVVIVLNTMTAPFNQLAPIFWRRIARENFYILMSYNGIFFNFAILLGGAFMMLKKQWKRKAALIIGSQYLGIIAWFLIALAGFGLPFWFVYIATTLTGLYVSIYGTTYKTIFHETIPPEKLGRVFSVDFAISFFLGPFATLASGPLADWLGLENLYMGIAIIAMVFMTLMVIFSEYRLVGKDTMESQIKSIEVPDPSHPLETKQDSEEISKPVKSI